MTHRGQHRFLLSIWPELGRGSRAWFLTVKKLAAPIDARCFQDTAYGHAAENLPTNSAEEAFLGDIVWCWTDASFGFSGWSGTVAR